MPNVNLTELIILLDRSGSMKRIKEDMEGGVDTFIEEQKKGPGDCRVSQYQFDNDFEVVYENKDIKEVPKCELIPRGGTALRDALGKVIGLVGQRLAHTPEEQRPNKVIVLTITDGQENASKEWSPSALHASITEQREKYKWEFAMLGANIDSFTVARSYGIDPKAAQNYEVSASGVRGMATNMSKAVLRSRGTSGQSISFEPDPEDSKS